MNEIMRGDEVEILNRETIVIAEIGMAAVEHPVLASMTDTRPGIRPRDHSHMAGIDPFGGKRILDQGAQEVGTDAAEIACFGTEALHHHRDIDRISARKLDILIDIDVDGVVADAENADHSQYSVFHM